MGRSVVYNLTVKAQLEKILEEKENQIGLIIGQRIPQRDTVVYLCPTPIQDENDKEGNGEPSKSTPIPQQQRNSGDANRFQPDNAWTCLHAREVTRTLPGGIDILGLYVSATIDLDDKFMSNLKQILYSVHASLAKDREWSIHPDVTEGILLHICMASHKLTCRTFDIANKKSTPSPAEWKQLSSSPKLYTLTSEMAGDLKFPISHEKCNITVKKQLLTGFLPLFQRISTSVAVIDGVVRDLDENLVQSECKKSKQKSSDGQSFVVDLLTPLIGKGTSHSQATQCALMFDCKGTIHLRGFVHAKATVREAVKAIHQDAVRSLIARCEIHCEDLLVIDEEQQDPIVVYELPRRVFAPLGQTGLLVCDYQFHGDAAADSLSAFKELLNLDVSVEDIQAYESAPTTSSLIQPNVIEDQLTDNSSDTQNVLIPALGAALVAVAFGFAYIIIFQNV